MCPTFKPIKGGTVYHVLCPIYKTVTVIQCSQDGGDKSEFQVAITPFLVQSNQLEKTKERSRSNVNVEYVVELRCDYSCCL